MRRGEPLNIECDAAHPSKQLNTLLTAHPLLWTDFVVAWDASVTANQGRQIVPPLLGKVEYPVCHLRLLVRTLRVEPERVLHELGVRLLSGRRTARLSQMKAAQRTNGQKDAAVDELAKRSYGKARNAEYVEFLKAQKGATKQERKGTLPELVALVWRWAQEQTGGEKEALEARRAFFAAKRAAAAAAVTAMAAVAGRGVCEEEDGFRFGHLVRVVHLDDELRLEVRAVVESLHLVPQL